MSHRNMPDVAAGVGVPPYPANCSIFADFILARGGALDTHALESSARLSKVLARQTQGPSLPVGGPVPEQYPSGKGGGLLSR